MAFPTLKTSWNNYRKALNSYTPNKAVENVGKASGEYLEAQTMYGKDSAQAKIAEQELGVQKKLLEISKSLTNEKGKRLKGTKALDKANQLAYRNQLIAQQELNAALADEQDAITKYGEDSSQYEAAHAVVLEKKEELEIATEVAEITQKNAKTATDWKDSMSNAVSEISKYLTMVSDVAHTVADLTEAFGGDEEDVQFWNDIADGLSNITAGFGDLMNSIMSLNIRGIISSTITAVPKMLIGFMDIFSAGKIRKANKEIRHQQEIIDQLEVTYGRLQKVADKLFGRDYINNYNQQLRTLQAEQQAYLRQAEAEKSKGKKADKDKIADYEKSAREAAEKLRDLQDDLVSHFTGSSRADMARQMAQNWLDAKASLSNTFAAIKDDYKSMIKQMLVEGAAARIIENALTPVWDKMQKMLKNNNVDKAIDSLISGMDSALSAANNGMEILWKQLQTRGYDMREILGDSDGYTGIAKDVASATSEEINANTAALNTQNYYVSHIPAIAEHVAAIRAIIGSRNNEIPTFPISDYMALENEALEHLSAISRHTAETVDECRKIAFACQSQVSYMKQAFMAKGNTAGFNVFLK